ncbi:hypothetical protein C8J57DRAFT_1665666 [Mycena rebaudengoi]|nr:hypothetical protein C8J57DRAFT_1665666 [Mycena rebaudengoi]
MAKLPAPLPSIVLSHGPSFVGILVSCMLYGAMFVQVVTYYSRFPNDRTWTKLYVALLLLTDTTSTVLSVAWLYNLCIVNFPYADANWMIAADPGMVGITAGVCQLFFAWRISVLTQNPYLTVLIVIVSMVGSIGAVGVSGTIGVIKSFERFHSQGMKIFGSIWLVFALLCDVMISAVLTWNLKRKKSGFNKNTDNMLDRIIAITLANGALTSALALVELCFFLGQPDTGVHVGFSWILGKLYTNSVMSSLNLRRMNRGGNIVSTSGMSSGHGSRRPPLNDPLTFVHVSTEQDGPYGWDTTKHAVTFGPADSVAAHPKRELPV